MSRYDTIVRLSRCTIQHGKYNDRVYLMKLHSTDLPGIVDEVERLAHDHGYTKIFAKVPEPAQAEFLLRDYRREGFVPCLYHGTTGGVFLGRYLDRRRATDLRDAEIQTNLGLARQRSASGALPAQDGDLELALAGPEAVEEMAAVYRKVFASYPFPIHDPAYLHQTMSSHVRYFLAKEQGRIIALSSAELDFGAGNVEMTDFATLPECRGRSIAVRLLTLMEGDPEVRKMSTAYTIARAMSPGMNITFARRGYAYGGTLVNNTNISGSIESMNVWYKRLPTTGRAQ